MFEVEIGTQDEACGLFNGSNRASRGELSRKSLRKMTTPTLHLGVNLDESYYQPAAADDVLPFRGGGWFACFWQSFFFFFRSRLRKENNLLSRFTNLTSEESNIFQSNRKYYKNEFINQPFVSNTWKMKKKISDQSLKLVKSLL